jgi:cell division protein FtsI (penicillin-binding protein 3)
MTAIIANGGVASDVNIARAVVDRNGSIVQDLQKNGSKVVVSPDTANAISAMMRKCVTDGTGISANIPHISIAGKTGTAQIIIPGQGYSSKNHRMTFVGYFPADKPLYSCVIVIDNPSNGYYATTVAAPVFREIADKVYSMAYVQYATPEYEADPSLPVCKNGLKYDFEMILDELGMELTGWSEVEDTDWVLTSSAEGEELVLKPRLVDDAKVPNVRGMGLRDALYLLENAGLQVGVFGSGMVQKQSLQPGSKVAKGTYIQIELK